MQVSASTDSGLEKNGLGLDVGGSSREAASAGRSANATPVNGGGANRNGGRARAGAGQKRSRADEEAEEGEDEIDAEPKPAKKTSTAKKASVPVSFVPPPEPELETDAGDPDTRPYCTCQRPSYGEMIGCDNDDCDYEWVSFCASDVLTMYADKCSSIWLVLVLKRHQKAIGHVRSVPKNSRRIRSRGKEGNQRLGSSVLIWLDESSVAVFVSIEPWLEALCIVISITDLLELIVCDHMGVFVNWIRTDIHTIKGVSTVRVPPV